MGFRKKVEDCEKLSSYVEKVYKMSSKKELILLSYAFGFAP